jgi:4-hydroxy-tetrahydrodipicolinate synthase
MSMAARSHLFAGLSAFPLTPADPDGRVDTQALSRLLERLCEAKVHSIKLLGSTGIYAYLSPEERCRAVKAAVECVGGRVPLIVGVGALRTDQAIHLGRAAEAEGADALLMAPVSYTPLTQDEAFEHYRAMASASGLPFCVYNNPGTTRFTFSIDLLERLSRLPTIQAVKMPLPTHGDFAGELAVLRERTDLSVGYSGDWGTADAMLAGLTPSTASLAACCRIRCWPSFAPLRLATRRKPGVSTRGSRRCGTPSRPMAACA